MSSDGYFDDDPFDEAVFAQLDAIEAAYTATNASKPSTSHSHVAASTPPPIHKQQPSKPKPVAKDDSFYDLTLDLDAEELEKLDAFIADSYAGKSRPVVGPTRQTTLFGDVLPNTSQVTKPTSRQGMERTTSNSRNLFGSKPKKTKVWDQTAFAQSGQRKKGKGRLFEEDEEEEEQVEFEQFPAPFVPPGEWVCSLPPYFTPTCSILLAWSVIIARPPPPMKLKPDLLEAKHWLYPLNKPKRDYQFNIVKNSLFENTIISVPTGLGKTFIAGVIMLNYYRWFPDGKVVFVAPTKPLVAQQIEASHQSCGIPGSDATEMTGEIPKIKREKLWREKRIFYMTPQTLMNDLSTQNCDVMDIVLLIVDEAHKATGDYAYNQIVRYMMAKNPHFRLIALTATPGSNPMAVQNLVDGLHISHIEIRNEESIDLREYIHHKKVEQHCIKAPQGIALIRDLLAQLMDTFLKPLKARGIMWPEQRAIKLHPYAARAKMGTLAPDQKGLFGHLSVLGNLAQVMGYLLEGTVGMAYSYLKEISEKDMDEQARKNQQVQSKKLRENDLFKKTVAAFEALRTSPTGPFPPHPKMEKAVHLLVEYYGQKLPDNDWEESEESEESSGESKAMVFVTHREAVDEIVEALNMHQPMIRASRFIGQGTDKHGKRGQAQKEQLETIQKFQSGVFNVLVATCIGEEGLDIGEVDLIICYDTQKTPIRMLQRFGRTGRKRAGCVHVLLAEDREEFNLDKARASYKEVQRTICRGDDVEFYSDVKRLLPEHIKPVPLERVMEIRPYIREDRSRAKRPPTKPSATTKRKRNDDIMRNIPAGACTGFVSVADLIVSQSKKRKVVDVKNLEAEAEDDDLDKALDAGVEGLLSGRRTQSLVSTLSKSYPWDEENLEKPKGKGKGKMKRAATVASKAKPKPKKKDPEKGETEGDEEGDGKKGGKGRGKGGGRSREKAKQKGVSISLSQQGRDDSVDRELENGPFARWEKTQKESSLFLNPAFSPSRSPSPQVPRKRTKNWLSPLTEDVAIDLSDEEMERHRSEMPVTQADSRLEDQSDNDNMAWLVADDDDDSPDIVILSSSPMSREDATHDESVEFVDFAPSNPRIRGTYRDVAPKPPTQLANNSVLELSSEADIPLCQSSNTSPEPEAKKAIPLPCQSPNPYLPGTPMLESTQPIRRAGRRAPKRHAHDSPSSDAELEIPPPSQRRLRRCHYSPTAEAQPKPKEKERKSLTKRKHNPLLEYAAEHSGDDVSAGSSNSEDDVESESDRLFIKDSPMTQMASSYDQTSMYRKSLMTQAPGGGPAFARGPIRNKPFGRMEPRKRRRVVDSSPPPEDDEYEFGSFVVDNDAEISYLTQAEISF